MSVNGSALSDLLGIGKPIGKQIDSLRPASDLEICRAACRKIGEGAFEIFSCPGSKVELVFFTAYKASIVPRIHLLLNMYSKLESCEATYLNKDEVMGSKA